MAWRETTVVKQRWEFVEAWLQGEISKTALCRRFGISRKTGYKWVARHASEGRAGLADRSRAPHCQAGAVKAEVVQAIVSLRRRRGWGARKLVVELRQQLGRKAVPSLSTVERILQREGLTRPQRKRRRVLAWRGKLTAADRANRVWRADYKGHVTTGDGERVEPLTVTDGYSRYLVVLCASRGTGEREARAAFEAAFMRYGLPDVILTDNGNPFVSTTLTGLTRLAVWWLKLGIRHERIAPGRWYQNGSHERFHSTLCAATLKPPAATRRAQRQRFARFQQLYNEERPHEALGQVPPAHRYRPSPRRLPQRLPAPAYAPDMMVRRVRRNGEIKWQGRLIYIGEVLAGELLGLRQDPATGLVHVYFYARHLGAIEARGKARLLRHVPPPPRGRRHMAMT
ncbi:integrase core domain-containing protein [Reyranella sp. CPCC 100927]|uniref:integrase core domain-containing protein n=1 Tax=Reyranella sp. CPCC 100927 TaxID=2599616 RepID=UPI0011B5EA8C|nr:integrase core domain-containing protein [Reyranella sp. CPCC 100927]TWS92560.1 transposase [Reyranella sp. CPCC 100927]